MALQSPYFSIFRHSREGGSPALNANAFPAALDSRLRGNDGQIQKTKLQNSQRGFTLLELVLVLGILAITAGSVLVLARPDADATELRRTATTIAAQMRATRAHAISRNSQARFSVDLVNRTYWNDTSNKRTPFPATIAAEFETDAAEILGADLASIRFEPNGQSSGGTLVLSSPRSGAYAISIEWLTGQVKLKELR